jgi:hypothetical protein
MHSTGAYRDRYDPGTVYIWACADAPGGKFGALRVGGIWRHFNMTFGDLADDFLPVEDPRSRLCTCRRAPC